MKSKLNFWTKNEDFEQCVKAHNWLISILFIFSFDLFTKFLVVIGIWWLFHTLSLFQYASLKYTGIIFNLVEGPAVFCVAMCRTRVAFLFKKYFCGDWCCFKSEEFINEECQELATIDMLRSKVDEPDSHPNGLGIKDYLQPFINGHASSSSNDKEMSKSLFNMRNNHREPGEIPPPPNPEIPVGRIKRLLKSNSLTALTNINFGWRKETAVWNENLYFLLCRIELSVSYL